MNKLKWTKIIGLVGLIVGGVSAANYKITYPTEIIGFALPYVLLFLAIGLVIDFIASRLK